MHLRRIPSLQEKKDVTTLAKFLTMQSAYLERFPGFDTYEKLRAEAVDALAQIGDTRAVEPLIAALNDSYWVSIRAPQKL